MGGGGLPWWSGGWESACQCRRHRFNPCSRKILQSSRQLSPCTTSYWSPRVWSLCSTREATEMSSPQIDSSPLSPKAEKVLSYQWRPSAANTQINLKKIFLSKNDIHRVGSNANWCPYKKGRWGHRQAQRESSVRIQGEDGHPHAKQRGLLPTPRSPASSPQSASPTVAPGLIPALYRLQLSGCNHTTATSHGPPSQKPAGITVKDTQVHPSQAISCPSEGQLCAGITAKDTQVHPSQAISCPSEGQLCSNSLKCSWCLSNRIIQNNYDSCDGRNNLIAAFLSLTLIDKIVQMRALCIEPPGAFCVIPLCNQQDLQTQD